MQNVHQMQTKLMSILHSKLSVNQSVTCAILQMLSQLNKQILYRGCENSRDKTVHSEHSFPLGGSHILRRAVDEGLGLAHRVEPGEHQTKTAPEQENI